MTNTDEDHYRNYLLATVSIADGKIEILGGPKEKRILLQAKKSTSFCYVRDIHSKSEVKLTLVDGEWFTSGLEKL
jgi:hypothetical protein